MSAKADQKPAQLSGAALYSRFALAGAICCSVTHGALTPVDVYVPALPSSQPCAAMRASIASSARPAWLTNTGAIGS